MDNLRDVPWLDACSALIQSYINCPVCDFTLIVLFCEMRAYNIYSLSICGEAITVNLHTRSDCGLQMSMKGQVKC